MHRSITPSAMKHDQILKSYYIRNLPKYMVSQANIFKLTNYDLTSEISTSHSVLKPSSLIYIQNQRLTFGLKSMRNRKQTTKLNNFNLWCSRMQHKPFHVTIQVKHDLGLCRFYSQALPNVENTVQNCMGKAVEVLRTQRYPQKVQP